MEDINNPKIIEILIREDGTTIWINNEFECVFRACRIKKLIIKDERKEKFPGENAIKELTKRLKKY